MKIVQSFWSRPSLKKENLNNTDRNTGGWADKKYNLLSWALSCLQFRKYYEEVELVTDQQGYDLLIGQLELPYTSVKVVLNELDQYHPDLWALGKIYAYSIQDEPFIHADGDVYIWQKFSDAFESAPLMAQNIERDFGYYSGIFKQITEHFEFIPSPLLKSIEKNTCIDAVNAGIIGGTDIGFFKKYTKAAFRFINDNKKQLSRINVGMFNIIYEQFLFNAMAEEAGIPIDFFTRDINHAFDGLAELTGVPDKVKYVHPVGVYKKMNYIGSLVAHHMQKMHPDYYYRTIASLRTYQA